MTITILLWVILLTCIKISIEYSRAEKFVQQKDMSEHCRRRVVPSVFLGRQVAESSAEVMHFSRLEIPYSCSINVRTESGSSIILVIISKSQESIPESCKEGHDQLLVYEMGETFGGYWGALPESIFRQESNNYSTYYTLKTTYSTTESIDRRKTHYSDSNYTEEVVSPPSIDDGVESDRNFVIMEVPLVNVSGNIPFGDSESKLAGSDNHVDELFDFIYDVTPKQGVLYETSIMPLVQFSVWKTLGRQRLAGREEIEPRYQLDYNMQGVTQDYRLTYRTKHGRKHFHRPYFSNKRLKFRKNHLFAVNNNRRSSVRETILREHYGENIRQKSYIEEQKYITGLLTTNILHNSELHNKTINILNGDMEQVTDSYIKSLRANDLTTNLSEVLDQEAIAILKKKLNMRHSTVSGYFQPNVSNSEFRNISWITSKCFLNTKNNTYNTGKILSTLLFSINVAHQYSDSTHSPSILDDLSPNSLLSTTEEKPTSVGPKNIKRIRDDPVLNKRQNNSLRDHELKTIASLPSLDTKQVTTGLQLTTVVYTQPDNDTNKAATYMKSNSESGSLVDHESWENVVQVAPVMAELLNVATRFNVETMTPHQKEAKNFFSKKQENMVGRRKKKFIQAISIDDDRPHHLIRKQNTNKPDRKVIFESQDLAEVVELQDDEISGRVALHYFKSYVGSPVYNICNYHEPKPQRQVYLFNSSRIVISINNFTMDRMTIVMTESQIARQGCRPSHLECQLSGVRVCVHYINACDGIPNCGAYDIYDEDRLLCGNTDGFRYTVWLAACIFLLVLLTLLYSIHYWIRRCVPRVSQAFFVYTDKSENTLYLDSIMRSPHDFDMNSHQFYHGVDFEDDILSTSSIKVDDKSFVYKLRRCVKYLFRKKQNLHFSEDKAYEEFPDDFCLESKREFSFAQSELRKMNLMNLVNKSAQTGDSLELAHTKQKRRLRRASERSSDARLRHHQEKLGITSQSANELNIIRGIRDISAYKQSSSESNGVKLLEDNLKNHVAHVEEVELKNTMYDRRNKIFPSTVGSIGITCDNNSIPHQQMKNAPKHLRFEEGPTTIPLPLGLSEIIDENNRIVRIDSRLSNINLDDVEEDHTAASSSGRDFMRFWGGGKGKKNKKKKHISLR